MRICALIILQLITISLFGQGTIGSWEDHLPYHSLKTIVAGENNIYSASDYSIAVYNKDYQEIHKLSTVQGLSECGISALAYSDDNKTLIIAYHSTNIDLYSNNVITNIPDISNKYIAGRKTINSISTVGSFAYLATSFGLVVLDIEDLEINDTWNPSLSGSPTEVFDIEITGSTIYATTTDGVLSADFNNPGLAYFGNWHPVSGLEYGNYKNIVAAGDNLFISKKALGPEGDSLLLFSQGGISAISAGSGQRIHSLRFSDNSLILAKGSEIELFNTDGILIRKISDYGWGAANCMDAIIDNNKLFIADYNKGLVIEQSSLSFESVIIPGPWSISAANIHSSNGNIYIAAGELTNSWDNTWKPFETSISIDRMWSSYTDISFSDAISIIPHPGDPSKTYVATWGTGLFLLDESGIVEHFDDSNSPLESMIPGSDYVRIAGMTFDENNYLWLTQPGVQNSIKVLKPDNTWIVLPYTINAPLVGEIIISRSGKKWIILPNGNGLFVLDDNRSPDNFGDDQWIKLNVQDQFGKSLNNIYSLAEDMDGNIWIGTDQGPAIYYSPDRVFSEEIFCYRIKVSRNDGSGLADYLLGTEKIKNISIDGGNRKWLGTNNSGVFLIGEEGNELVKSYSEDNSPLLSDTITSLAINEITGEVWIGSSKGVISVREEATEGFDDFKKVYAFPNPVHPDFNGPVTITGLARNTRVKISDVSGNLVYETTSTGGQATWDLNNYKKQRVATGVYLAFCSTEDGSTSEVIKILIVR